MAQTLADIRKQYPGAYDDMSDQQLADAMYAKHYADMPRGEFDRKIGLGVGGLTPIADQRGGGIEDMMRRDMGGGDSAPRYFNTAKHPKAGSAIMGAQDTAFFGFDDEAFGGLMAGMEGVFGDWTKPGKLERMGDVYRKGRDQMRAFKGETQEDNPISYMGGQFAGALPAGGVTSGLAKTATHGLARRIGTGALIGAGFGGTYGYGSGEGGFTDRLDDAGRGAAWGAAFGGGFPIVAKVAEPITTPIGNAFKNTFGKKPPMKAAGVGAAASDEQPGMFGGLPSGEAPLKDKAQEQAIKQLSKMAERRDMTPDSLDQKLDEFIADPRGRIAAELFDQQGRTRIKRLAEMPGKTADDLAPKLRTRLREQGARLMQALDRSTGPQEARQALTQLADEFEQASKTLYQPVLAQNVNASGAERAAQVMQRFPPEVIANAEKIMTTIARAEGVEVAAMNEATRLHMMKRALDDAIDVASRKDGLGGSTFRAFTGLKRDYVRALDEAIPGYRQAREQWSGLKDAEEAVEMGQSLFSTNPDEAIAYAQSLTESQAQFFAAGAKTAIRQRIEQGDKALSEGARNVADAFLSTNQAKRLQAALGDKADDFTRALQSEDQAYRAAREMLPGSGSQTFRLFQDLADEDIPLSPSGWATKGVRWAAKGVTDWWREPARNREGRALMTAVDPASQSFNYHDIQRLRVLLREAMKRRRNRTQAAYVGAAEGGLGGGAD